MIDFETFCQIRRLHDQICGRDFDWNRCGWRRWLVNLVGYNRGFRGAPHPHRSCHRQGRPDFLKDLPRLCEYVSVRRTDRPETADQAAAATRSSLVHRLRDWGDDGSWQDFFDTYWKLIYSVAVKAGLRAPAALVDESVTPEMLAADHAGDPEPVGDRL